MSRKQTNWNHLSAKDTVRLLESDPVRGLSGKAASGRTKAEGASLAGGPLLLRWFKRFASAPLFIILSVATILALFFAERKEAASILLFLAFFVIFVSKIIFSITQSNLLTGFYKMPMARVIRDGKSGFLLSSGVVAGDIILLRCGDVVPCNCRLLTAKNLSVLVRTVNSETHKMQIQTLEKRAETIYPEGDFTEPLLCENMLAAGCVVLSGMARAIAVENGGLPMEEKNTEKSDSLLPSGMNLYGNYLRYAEMLSLFFIILQTVCGILILPNQVGILRIFLPICALTLAGSAVIPTLFLHAFWASAKRRFLRKKGKENRCVFESFETLGTLPEVTDLILLGNEALSDGILHFDSAWVGGQVLSSASLAKRKNAEVDVAIGDAFYYLEKGMKTAKDAAFTKVNLYRILGEEWFKKTGFDKEASDVRLKKLTESGNEEAEVIEAELQDEIYRYAFVTEEVFSYCNAYLSDNGSICELDKTQIKLLKSYREEEQKKGRKLLFVLREKDEQVVLLGLFALKEEALPNLTQTLQNLQNEGVRVTAFLNSNDSVFAPFSAFDSVNAPISNTDLILADSTFEESVEKYRIFKDIPRESIIGWVTNLKRSGCCVAIVGNSVKDMELLDKANIKIACDGAFYHAQRMSDGMVEHFPETTFCKGSRAPDVIRESADVLIPRGGLAGGGLLSVQNGIAICKEVCAKIMFLVPMLAACLAFRLLVLMGCIFTGLGLPQSFWLLWCGVGLDCALFTVLSPAGSMKIPKKSFAFTEYLDIFYRPTFWIRPVALAVIFIFLLRFSVAMGWFGCEQALTLIVALMIPLQVFFLPVENAGIRPALWRVLLGFLIPILPLIGCFFLTSAISNLSLFFELSAWTRTMKLIPVVTLFSAALVNLPLFLLERNRSK